jgi:hypothetical protein
MAHPTPSSLDIHMPLLAFMGLMLEHGMAVSEQTWDKIDSIDAGEQLDEEIERAVVWLNGQNKSNAVSAMVREVCQNQEVMTNDTHWARVVGMPVVGNFKQMNTFAQRWAAQEMGNLGESPRLPHDAQWAWLPCVFDPVEVDRWLTAPRRWVIETVLAQHNNRNMLAESLRLLSKGMGLNPGKSASMETQGVGLMVGVLISTDKAWLDHDNSTAADLLHLGTDLHGLSNSVGKQLQTNGLSADHEAVQDHFTGCYGHSLDEIIEQQKSAMDHEMAVLDLMVAHTNVKDLSAEPIYPLAEALGRCSLLHLNLALNNEMDRRHVHGEIIFKEVHLAPGEADASGWVTAVTDTHDVWGPYLIDGIGLWEDFIPAMMQEAFEDRMPIGHETSLIFHDHASELPRGSHRLH